VKYTTRLSAQQEPREKRGLDMSGSKLWGLKKEGKKIREQRGGRAPDTKFKGRGKPFDQKIWLWGVRKAAGGNLYKLSLKGWFTGTGLQKGKIEKKKSDTYGWRCDKCKEAERGNRKKLGSEKTESWVGGVDFVGGAWCAANKGGQKRREKVEDKE